MAQRQLARLGILALGVAIGCGGDASVNNPQTAPNGTAAIPGSGTEGNAPSLIVPMSMVIPKKPVTPPVTTAPTQAAPQVPAGTGTFPQTGATPPAASTPTAPAAAGAPAAPTTPPATSGAAGAAAPTTPAGAGSTTAAGFETSGVPEAELAMLRETCVAEINMYRASLTDRMLKPITRATPEQEECSERGAKSDGDTNSAHGSARAGLCSALGLSSENTCPGWPVGGGQRGGGNATIADALKGCLKSMWAEGEPPVSREECQKDYQGCFLAHGHYLNMSDPSIASVACSFYKMMDGRSYWMNQDFTINWGRGRM